MAMGTREVAPYRLKSTRMAVVMWTRQGWHVQQLDDQVLESFGTEILPAPWGPTATPERVLSALRESMSPDIYLVISEPTLRLRDIWLFGRLDRRDPPAGCSCEWEWPDSEAIGSLAPTISRWSEHCVHHGNPGRGERRAG